MGIQRGGAAGSPRPCPWSVIVGGECGGGGDGRGGGVAGVEIKQEWGKAPGVNSNQHSTENVRRK